MKSIRFVMSGGLGNQLFQYAAYLYARKKYAYDKVWMDFWQYRYDHYHNGIEINKIFRADEAEKMTSVNESYRLLHKLKGIKPIIAAVDAASHKVRGYRTFYDAQIETPDLMDGVTMTCDNVTFGGLFQNSSFADEVKDELFARFDVRLNDRNQLFLDSLKGRTVVSVHIRRGDYVGISKYNVFNGLDYYRRAIDYMSQNVDNPHFVMFSDDISWSKKNLPLKDCSYVDWNKGNDSYQDMILMSRCHHNIIANSSFSWWGAYLNQSPSKSVVSPNLWFKGKPAKEVVPNDWILLEN